jgi:hypothetical protein
VQCQGAPGNKMMAEHSGATYSREKLSSKSCLWEPKNWWQGIVLQTLGESMTTLALHDTAKAIK